MADMFRPGDAAPCSGVFKVVHSLQHVAPHYVIALYRDTFLPCLECGDEVRFELALSAVYVQTHPAFHRP
ncbi:MAG TPA: hypothetical protein VMB18_05005 [Terriglobales bacterium]|nr:hypothetical protein [Terriglobales bacterium]